MSSLQYITNFPCQGQYTNSTSSTPDSAIQQDTRDMTRRLIFSFLAFLTMALRIQRELYFTFSSFFNFKIIQVVKTSSSKCVSV